MIHFQWLTSNKQRSTAKLAYRQLQLEAAAQPVYFSIPSRSRQPSCSLWDTQNCWTSLQSSQWWDSFSHCIKYDKNGPSENGKVPIYTIEKARFYPHAEKIQSKVCAIKKKVFCPNCLTSSVQLYTGNNHRMGSNFTTTDLWSSQTMQPHMSLTVHWFTVREKNSFWQITTS